MAIMPTLDYRHALAGVLRGSPTDLRQRTPHPPLIAQSYHNGSWQRAPLPPGVLPPRCQVVVRWCRYAVTVIHGDDGHTYAYVGDGLSGDNVTAIYLLAEGMHVF